MEVVMDSSGGEVRGEFMETQANKSAEDLVKIRREIIALRRRLKATARRNRKLSSDTEMLLRKVEKPD
jgi:hypothetical protein